MSVMSNLDQMLQTVEVKRVDYFPNGRGRRWLVIYQGDDHTWSIGLIEKPNNTATERHPYRVYAYDPPLQGDMSDPHWAGSSCSPISKLIGHDDFSRHDKVNDSLDDYSYPAAPTGSRSTFRSSPACTMVQDVVIHMSGVHPPVS